MSAADKDPSCLEITCRQATEPQMLNLTRELSQRLGHQKIELYATPGASDPDLTLRCRLSAESAKEHGPVIQSLLRTLGLLETSTTLFRHEATGQTHSLGRRPNYNMRGCLPER